MEKTLTVDWDSLESINKTINVLKAHRGTLNKNPLGSRKDRNRKIFDACQNIWTHEISEVYANQNLDQENKDYYVYAHCDPCKKIAVGYEAKTTFLASLGITHHPIYFGKGRTDRCYDLDRNGTHRKYRQNLKDFGKDFLVFKIKENLSEIEALCFESKLIDVFGIQGKGGRLVNLDEGVKHRERRLLYKDDYLLVSSTAREKEDFQRG